MRISAKCTPLTALQFYLGEAVYFINWNSNSQSLQCFYAMTNGDFLHWSVPLNMSPQRTWVRAGKVTLVAFV